MSDPGAVRAIAVTRADVVDAFVYTKENPGTAVLRLTPPFHGRMRARLHVERSPAAGTPGVHVPPGELLESSVADAYPGATDERDHAEWRRRAGDAIREQVSVEPIGQVRVAVLES